jgi:hypothetical protein
MQVNGFRSDAAAAADDDDDIHYSYLPNEISGIRKQLRI